MMSPPGLEEEEITSGRRLTPAQDVFLFLPSLSFFFCRRRRRERRDPADKENLVGWPGENASLSFSPGKRRSTGHSRLFCVLWTVSSWNTFNREREFSFPRLIVVPLSSHAVDGVRKEKERLTAAEAWRLNSFILFLSHLSTAMIWKEEDKEEESRKKMWNRSRFPMTFSFFCRILLLIILFWLEPRDLGKIEKEKNENKIENRKLYFHFLIYIFLLLFHIFPVGSNQTRRNISPAPIIFFPLKIILGW